MAKVFISYSKYDYRDEDGKILRDNVIDKIISALENNGISFWIDKERLQLGDNYTSEIAHNIECCEMVLFLSTANSNKSQWVEREIHQAANSGKPICPVHIDDAKFNPSLSLILSNVQYIDWMKYGEENALSQIVARIKNQEAPKKEESEKLPRITSVALYAGCAFLVFMLACMHYTQFGDKYYQNGGIAVELCILSSVYYFIRLLRLRKCTFIFPILICGFVIAYGNLITKSEMIWGAGLFMLAGWLFVLIISAIDTKKRRSLFKQMRRKREIYLSDPENWIFVYLLFKIYCTIAGENLIN